MAISPKFFESPILEQIEVSAANASYNGTGTIVTLAVGDTLTSLVQVVRVQAIGTPTAGAINLFVNNGATTKFYRQIPVEASSLFSVDTTINLNLPMGYKLEASTLNAEVFNLFATGGNY